MSVVILLGIIFLETLTALFGVVASVFVFKEFLQRRRFFLLLFSLTFLCIGVLYSAMFAAQVLSLFGGDVSVAVIIKVAHVMRSMAGMFMIFGLVDMFLKGGVQKTVFGAVAGVFATILAFDMYSDFSIVYVEGLPFSDFAIQGMFPFFSGILAANVVLVIIPIVRAIQLRNKGERLRMPDKYLFWSGVLCLSGLYLLTVFISFRMPMIILGVFALLFLSLFFLLTGVLSWEHPERRFVERPCRVFFRSFFLKTVGLNTIFYGFLTFVLVAFTASHFLSASNERHFDIVESSLVLRAENFSEMAHELVMETEQIALAPSVIRVFESGGASGAIEDVMPLLDSFYPDFAIRLLTTSGEVVTSGSIDETEAPTEDFSESSRAFLSGVAGVTTVMLEEESMVSGSLVLRSGAPIRDASGNIIGVVLVSGLSASFSGFDALLPSDIITGHGFVMENDEVVYESGDALDALTRHELERALVGRTTIRDIRVNHSVYSLVRVYGIDEESVGYFYMFTSEEVLAAEAARIIVTVTMLSLLATLLMMSILLYAMDRVVQPIRRLAEASRKIENGDFDVHIEHRSSDELGLLTDAFNRMTETIGEQTVHLREALREQKDFLMHTAQEMRNPLNHFRWTLEMLRFGEVGTLNQEQLEMVDQLSRTSERLQRMVQNIMDANKLTEGKVKAKFEPAALEEIIDDVAGTIVVDVRRKNINLHWKYPLTPLPKANIDTKMMHRVLSNLFSNAVKYTEKDGHIEVSVKEVDERRPGGKKGAYLQVAIEDNGIGIDEDEQSRVFTLFFRSKEAVEKDIEGAGLGLFITKKLVDLHKGALWFESQKGGGSSFYFTVPLTEADSDKG